jgi:histone acetyltransferase 1
MESLTLFSIDGARPIQWDHRWVVYLQYLLLPQTDGKIEYRIVGWTSVYHFYHYPSSLRPRISQVVILHPYRRQGHGTHIYSFLYRWYRDDEHVVDITVEDPNDGFQDLRDRCDLCLELFQSPMTMDGCDAEFIKSVQKKSKLSRQQVVRMVEVVVLRSILQQQKSARGGDGQKEYRLWIKKRVFKKNKDVLMDMSVQDRIVALEDTFRRIESDYLDLIKSVSC